MVEPFGCGNTQTEFHEFFSPAELYRGNLRERIHDRVVRPPATIHHFHPGRKTPELQQSHLLLTKLLMVNAT